MSDSPPPVRPAGPASDAPAAPLTPDAIERVLADFRAWLTDLAVPPEPVAEPPAVDLHTLVAQFTSLRHEVNLQTKATRSSLDQTGKALENLEGALDELRQRPAEGEDEAGPLLKALVDVYDNLALALRQVEKQRAAIDEPLVDLMEGTTIPEPPEAATAPPGFWGRLFGTDKGARLINWWSAAVKESEARRQRVADGAALVRSSFDGLIAGYRMSLARVDRAIEQAGLEVIATTGEKFDPELMEAVEVVGDTGRPAGEVVEEVRRGYLRGEMVFRYAQVKVAR